MVCLPPCRVNVILCEKACANTLQRRHPLTQEFPWFSFWHQQVFGMSKTKAQQVFDWKMLWKYIYFWNLPFTYYSTAQPKIIFCFPLYKAQQQWQKKASYLWIMSQAFCLLLPQTSISGFREVFPSCPFSTACASPPCFLALWRSFLNHNRPQNSLFNLEVPLSAASPCCSCET